jgi:hypothetical protein
MQSNPLLSKITCSNNDNIQKLIAKLFTTVVPKFSRQSFQNFRDKRLKTETRQKQQLLNKQYKNTSCHTLHTPPRLNANDSGEHEKKTRGQQKREARKKKNSHNSNKNKKRMKNEKTKHRKTQHARTHGTMVGNRSLMGTTI